MSEGYDSEYDRDEYSRMAREEREADRLIIMDPDVCETEDPDDIPEAGE